MKFLQDNGGLLAVLGVCFVIGAGYLEWRIDVNQRAQLAAADLASPAAVEANTESIEDLETADLRMDGKIERIVDILLEE